MSGNAVVRLLSESLIRQFPATKIITVDPTNIDDSLLMQDVVPALRNGDVVAFPTETVYGVGANALDANAVSKIFTAKGRPSDNPLIVHVSNFDQLKLLVDPKSFPHSGSLTRTLCDRFWPGPLTILFPKSDKVPSNVTAGHDHVAIRMPAHPIANRIIELSKLPLAAPSANRSGKPSPTCAYHVLQDLGRKQAIIDDPSPNFQFGKGIGVGYIVDGGECPFGVESTVIRMEDKKILRPGSITLEQLQSFDKSFQLFSGIDRLKSKDSKVSMDDQKEIETPATPGLKYTHYAPSVPVYLFEYDDQLEEKIMNFIESKVNENPSIKIGILNSHKQIHYNEWEGGKSFQNNLIVYDIGSSDSPQEIAKNLFAYFRFLDEDKKVDLIVMEGISEEKEGLAVMNRARKAALAVL